MTLILFEPVKYSMTLVQTKGFSLDFPCFSIPNLFILLVLVILLNKNKTKQKSVYTSSSTLIKSVFVVD